MRGSIPNEIENLFSEFGLDQIQIEIDRILKRQISNLRDSDFYGADKHLLMLRDLFVGALAWRLLSNSNDSNSIGKPTDNKIAGFLFLACFMTKDRKIEFEQARATSATYLATSSEKGTIGHFVVNKTYDAAEIDDRFLLRLIQQTIDKGDLKIQTKRDGKITIGFERLARLLGWLFAGMALLLGLAIFGGDTDGALFPAAILASVTGFGIYGFVRGLAWVIKGFTLEQP